MVIKSNGIPLISISFMSHTFLESVVHLTVNHRSLMMHPQQRFRES